VARSPNQAEQQVLDLGGRVPLPGLRRVGAEQDGRVGGAGSDLLMVKVNKDGRVSRNSNTASLDDFAALMNFVRLRVAKLAERILDGEIAVAPYRMGDVRPCSHCPYRGVCQFDSLVEGNGYRDLPSLDRAAAWEQIHAAGTSAGGAASAAGEARGVAGPDREGAVP